MWNAQEKGKMKGFILTIVNVTFKLLYFPYQIVGASVVRGNNSNLKRFIQLVVNVCEDGGGCYCYY